MRSRRNLDIHREGLSYAMLAKDSGFTFVLGQIESVDREAKTVHLAPVLFEEHEIFPERDLNYGTLVMAVGSTSNFFGTPGAAEFAIALDSTEQAERFRQTLLRLLVIADRDKLKDSHRVINLAIVGGGATGVELAAELVEACKSVAYYGLNHLDPARDVRIALLEGAPASWRCCLKRSLKPRVACWSIEALRCTHRSGWRGSEKMHLRIAMASTILATCVSGQPVSRRRNF